MCSDSLKRLPILSHSSTLWIVGAQKVTDILALVFYSDIIVTVTVLRDRSIDPLPPVTKRRKLVNPLPLPLVVYGCLLTCLIPSWGRQRQRTDVRVVAGGDVFLYMIGHVVRTSDSTWGKINVPITFTNDDMENVWKWGHESWQRKYIFHTQPDGLKGSSPKMSWLELLAVPALSRTKWSRLARLSTRDGLLLSILKSTSMTVLCDLNVRINLKKSK